MTLLWYGFARYNFAISVAKTSDVHLRFPPLYHGVASLRYVDFAIDVKDTGRILLSPSHISQINLFRIAINLLGFTLPIVRCWLSGGSGFEGFELKWCEQEIRLGCFENPIHISVQTKTTIGAKETDLQKTCLNLVGSECAPAAVISLQCQQVETGIDWSRYEMRWILGIVFEIVRNPLVFLTSKLLVLSLTTRLNWHGVEDTER